MRLAAILLVTGVALQGTSCIRYRSSIDIAGLDGTIPGTPAVSTITDSNPKRALSYLALGDSYTIGQSVDPSDRYPVQLVKMLNNGGLIYSDPEIIATSGWTTSNLLNAIRDKKADTPYDLVTLLIGVNNQYQRKSQAMYREEFASLLNQAIGLAGNQASHVIVLSIPDYSVTPFARYMDKELIISQLDSFNRINKEISRKYRVGYIDITRESRKAADDPSLVAGDGLHFSGKEYEIWAGMMERALTKI